MTVDPAVDEEKPGIAPSPGRLSARSEIRRKLIHIASGVIPLIVWFSPRAAALAILASIVVVALSVEWLRRRSRWARYHFLVATRQMLRTGERRDLAGATYMAVGYFAVAVVFPRPVAVAAMLFNALGDAAAALVGRPWGLHRTAWGKSWEGAIAGTAVNATVGLAIPGIPAGAALFGAIVAATIEFLPIPIDDNLRVTVGGGLALWAATVLGA